MFDLIANEEESKKIFREELLDFCAPFWLKNAKDEKYGGILNCLDRRGEVYSTDKSVWMQGRAGWTFSYLYNHIEKKEEYLRTAKSCIDFARKYCIDQADGRMYFTVTRDGKPLRKRRYWFSETFYIIANAEYYLATGDENYLLQAKRYFSFVYRMYCDPSSDPYALPPKTIVETRSLKTLANPMILLNVASVLRNADGENEAWYSDVILRLIDDIRPFYSFKHNIVFENVTTQNKIIEDASSCRVVNPGHIIECSWFILEEGMRRKDEELISFAEKIFNAAFDFGWDGEYGGLFYFKDISGRPVEAYEHDMKLWWPHNEAVIAALMFYRCTGKKRYAEIFNRVADYAFTHFSDREYGEWFGYLHRDGTPTLPPCKGHTYKGPFHVMRMLAKCLTLFQA